MKRNLIIAISLILLTTACVFSQTGMMKEGRSKTDTIKVGYLAPDFSLTDSNGKTVNLSSLHGKTVLVFYRGYWCPFCLKQLADLRSLKQQGDGFEIFAISVDPAEKLNETRLRIAKDGKGELNFALLSDPGGKTINAYGVYDPAYAGQRFDGIPHPAIFILDKNRKVLWARVEPDYRKRPTNEEIREALTNAN